MGKESMTLETEAQAVLNELWHDKLIPFALNVGKMTKSFGHYTIHFHDSRMFTVDVPLIRNQSWADMVRTAVLARVAVLSGPLQNKTPVKA
jgi:hypothetical protein